MQQSRFRNLLGRFVQVFPVFIDIAGDAAGGIFLGHMYFLTHYYDWDQGWIYQRYEDLYEDTRLNRKSIDRVRGILKKKGILEERRENNPVRMFYRLDLEVLDTEIESHIVEGKYPQYEYSPTRNETDTITDTSDVQNGHLRRPKRTPQTSKTDSLYVERDLRKSLKKDLKPPSLYSPPGENGHTDGGNKGGKAKGKNTPSIAFSEFWAVYPKKVAKPRAWAAWRRQGCEAIAEQITDAARSHPSLSREPEFIPHPATWLNGRQWEDEAPKDLDADRKEQGRQEASARLERQRRQAAIDSICWLTGKTQELVTEGEIEAEIERMGHHGGD